VLHLNGTEIITGIKKFEVDNQYPLIITSGDINRGPIGIQFDGNGSGGQIGYLYADHSNANSPSDAYSFHMGSTESSTDFVLDNSNGGF